MCSLTVCSVCCSSLSCTSKCCFCFGKLNVSSAFFCPWLVFFVHKWFSFPSSYFACPFPQMVDWRADTQLLSPCFSVWNQQMFQGDSLEFVFWAYNSTISRPQSVIFTSGIYSNEGFICFSSLCYFRSTLLSYLHYVWCVHRIPSDVCLRLYLLLIWIHVPLSRQNMMLLLSKQELKLRCILFISLQTIERYQQRLAAFAKVCLHTVKRKRNVRKKRITWTARCIVSKTRVSIFELIWLFFIKQTFSHLVITCCLFPQTRLSPF